MVTRRLRTDDGADLHLRVAEPDGPVRGHPVLLLHSLFFDGSMFEPVMARLAKHRLCLAPDHRGQGASTAGREAPTAERLAADMRALCAAFAPGPVHLVGSSMGAYVAMEMLAASPSDVRSMTISCCTCEAEADPARFYALAQRIARAGNRGMAADLLPLMFGAPFLSDPARATTRDRWAARFDRLPEATEAVVAAIFAHRGWTGLLRGWGGPILALSGAADRAKLPADLDWIGVEGLGRFRLYPEAGHTLPVEMPEAFADDLAAFLDEAETQAHDSVRGIA